MSWSAKSDKNEALTRTVGLVGGRDAGRSSRLHHHHHHHPRGKRRRRRFESQGRSIDRTESSQPGGQPRGQPNAMHQAKQDKRRRSGCNGVTFQLVHFGPCGCIIGTSLPPIVLEAHEAASEAEKYWVASLQPMILRENTESAPLPE